MYFFYRMDATYSGKSPTGDSAEGRDNISSTSTTSSMAEEKIDTSDTKNSGANPAAALKPTLSWQKFCV